MSPEFQQESADLRRETVDRAEEIGGGLRDSLGKAWGDVVSAVEDAADDAGDALDAAVDDAIALAGEQADAAVSLVTAEVEEQYDGAVKFVQDTWRENVQEPIIDPTVDAYDTAMAYYEEGQAAADAAGEAVASWWEDFNGAAQARADQAHAERDAVRTGTEG